MTELKARVQQALGSAYRIDRELGGGGMSHVFVAEEVALGRHVVVKVLPPELAATVNGERFEREIRVVAGLQHPGIVPLIAAGGGGDLCWFTMPFVEGDSLRARIAREGELPLGDAIRIWTDMLDALAFAHGRGVVHRDIKPDNVLLAGRRALVADFGVARALSSATTDARFTSTGLALGTPAYMSPEQAAGDPHTDHRADLYAAGLVMYEMLVGRSPFAERTPAQQMAAHALQAPTPVRELRPQVSPALAALVMRCLEKRPSDRPQSAEAMLQELGSIQGVTSGGSSASVASPAPAATPAGPRRNRRRALWVGGVLVVLVAGVAAIAGTGRLRVASPGAPLPDSARLALAILPVEREAGDSVLARGLAQRVMEALSTDPLVVPIPVEEFLPTMAAFIGMDVGRIERDTLLRWLPDLRTRAYLSMSLARAGAGFLLGASARAVASDSVLYSAQIAADAAADLPRATEEVIAGVRRALSRDPERIAMSRPSGAFHRTSADAVEAYFEAQAAFGQRDYLTAADRLRAAVRLDSTFASAWALLAFSLGNAGINVDERNRARAASFRHRARLRFLPEQLAVEAEYYRIIGAPERAIPVFERLEREFGGNPGQSNSLGLTYAAVRRYEDAARTLARARDTTYRRTRFANQNYVMLLLDLGRLDDARRELHLLDSLAGPDNASTRVARTHLLRAERKHDSVAIFARRQLEGATSAAARLAAAPVLLNAMLARGQLLGADRIAREHGAETGLAGARGARLADDLTHVYWWMHLTGDTASAVQRLDSLLAATPWEGLAPMDRPYGAAIRALGAVGRIARARALGAEWERAVPGEFRPATYRLVQGALGEAELLAGSARAALEHFRRSDGGACDECFFPDYARAWDRIGNADSALVWYERFLNERSGRLAENDAYYLAESYRRSAELHESRGDLPMALRRYSDLVALWRDADASLQPLLTDVKARIDRLRAASR